MSRKGVIQNQEYLQLAYRENRKFVIPCENEKDAHSKRVSLHNARRCLSEVEQRRIRISKRHIDGLWVVEIYRASTEILEEIDGKFVTVKEKLQDDSLQMMHEMLEQGLSKDEIVEILTGRGELKETIEEALDGSN
jgi:hypothetical protein